jgi:hypothetical protein
MNYTIKAHPTEYKGVMFRSRLEARWAAFFDLEKRNWMWEYEPVDLEGWTPDFRFYAAYWHECLGGMRAGRKFAEVKPAAFWDQFPIEKIKSAVQGEKYEGVAYLLGNDPTCIYEVVCGKEVPVYMSERLGFMDEEWNEKEDCYNMSISPYARDVWNKAGALVQWKPSKGENNVANR